MSFHGAVSDEEPFTHGFVRKTFGDQGKHLSLAWAELRQWVIEDACVP